MLSRASVDQYDSTGLLIHGYDYINQAWIVNGKYVRCGHSPSVECNCYGRIHAGQPSKCRPATQHAAANGHHNDCGDKILPDCTPLCAWYCPLAGVRSEIMIPNMIYQGFVGNENPGFIQRLTGSIANNLPRRV